jgi:proline racemase
MGYIILESTEYPAMSGSNTICVATALLEMGIIPMRVPFTELVLEAPAGVINVRCTCRDGKVQAVRFTNQPAFVYYLDADINVDGIGRLTVDVAYGGMTYVIVEAAKLGFHLVPDEARYLSEIGERIKAAAAAQLPVRHPENDLIAGITQTEFTGPLQPIDGGLSARNAVVGSPGRLDRCPCGTGTSARLAVLHARGQIELGETLIHESIIGTSFVSTVDALTTVGRYPAVVSSISGQAWITAVSEVGLDPTDPMPEGYRLSDTWPRYG